MKLQLKIWIILFGIGLTVEAQATDKFWIYFKDKGYSSSSDLGKLARQSLSSRAIQRRILRGDPERILDESDLPVCELYVETVASLGAKVRMRSRWLNAVSVQCESDLIDTYKLLPFVQKVAPVLVFIRQPEETFASTLGKTMATADTNLYDYGNALNQAQLIMIPALHNVGLTGKGVLVTLIDTGFHYQIHEAFRHLRIVAERDFINHDDLTMNEPEQDSFKQHDHGTEVLSVIAGFQPGVIIGPAFGADYMLAKSEIVPTETRIEEDNWVAAVEWADSLGTDVISSSLSYRDFDDGFAYSYEDLNGQTMVTTIAANIAVAKGIVVVVAAGNEGDNMVWPYISGPADGFGVLAIGAVDALGNRVSFSSIGPTADGRIKPDVMAMGFHDVFVRPNDTTGVAYGNGTSFATPLIAGVCALLLEKHPNWRPSDIKNAVTTTASRANMPDNLYGWGIVNAQLAAVYLPEGSNETPRQLTLHPAQTSLVQDYTCFIFDLYEAGEVDFSVFNALGQQVEMQQRWFSAGLGKNLIWHWSPELAAGVYFARFKTVQNTAVQKLIIVR